MILIIDLDNIFVFLLPFYVLYQLDLEIHHRTNCESDKAFTTWQFWSLAALPRQPGIPQTGNHSIQYILLLASIMILIIDLDQTFLFLLSFYVLYQLDLEIHHQIIL